MTHTDSDSASTTPKSPGLDVAAVRAALRIVLDMQAVGCAGYAEIGPNRAPRVMLADHSGPAPLVTMLRRLEGHEYRVIEHCASVQGEGRLYGVHVWWVVHLDAWPAVRDLLEGPSPAAGDEAALDAIVDGLAPVPPRVPHAVEVSKAAPLVTPTILAELSAEAALDTVASAG